MAVADPESWVNKNEDSQGERSIVHAMALTADVPGMEKTMAIAHLDCANCLGI